MSSWTPGDDFESLTDGLEPAVLVRRDGSRQTLTRALRRATERREAEPLAGDLSAADVTWHASAAELDAAPELGAVIEDGAGGRWTILEVRRATLGRRWELRCRALELAWRLEQRITIERAEVGKGPEGDPRLTWGVWRANVPAKVQRWSGRVERDLERRLTEVTHLIYTLETLAVGHTYRVRHEGRIYKVNGFRQADRLGQPAVIEAREDPWPL